MTISNNGSISMVSMPVTRQVAEAKGRPGMRANSVGRIDQRGLSKVAHLREEARDINNRVGLLQSANKAVSHIRDLASSFSRLVYKMSASETRDTERGELGKEASKIKHKIAEIVQSSSFGDSRLFVDNIAGSGVELGSENIGLGKLSMDRESADEFERSLKLKQGGIQESLALLRDKVENLVLLDIEPSDALDRVRGAGLRSAHGEIQKSRVNELLA